MGPTMSQVGSIMGSVGGMMGHVWGRGGVLGAKLGHLWGHVGTILACDLNSCIPCKSFVNIIAWDVPVLIAVVHVFLP